MKSRTYLNSNISLRCLYFGTLFLLLNFPLNAEVVYKIINDDGVPLFSDKTEGASEKLMVSESNRIKSLKPNQRRVSNTDEKKIPLRYDLKIISPPRNYTYRNNEKVPVKLSLKPPLAAGSGHEVRIFLDGNLKKQYGSSLNFQIGDLDRGTHTLKILLTDITGQELASSESRTFFVQKVSILSRNQVNN